MIPLPRLVWVAAVWMCMCGITHGQFAWEQTEVEFRPSPAETEVVAHFKFKNKGNRAVNVASVTTSCGCATAALPKRRYEAGESGEIVATFKLGDRQGLQEKLISVTSDDPDAPLAILIMRVHIPQVLEVKPAFVRWEPGEVLTSKTIHVRVQGQFPVNTLEAASSNPRVAARVEMIKKGSDYEIVVTPQEATESVTALLSIRPDYPAENPKTYFVNIRVR